MYKSSNDVEDIALIATGSEVQIALNAAYKLFIEDNLHISVVSVPCFEIFSKTNLKYRSSVFRKIVV